jgi:hypothetical protein
MMRAAGRAYNSGSKDGDTIVMLDIGWRGAMLAMVFLVDLLVFIDLASAELRELKGRRVKRAARQAALGTDARVAPGSARS